ncbi:MAG: 2-C-methyl-D-erythritol 2,4-cyclodiphosphate synthase [Candidatus Kapaibacterium sp.]|jgi:2-C-methyl-D-erythritol 2,4-cyclodiphosphate synthase|nr:2-C-methyl-D-erythritol 2,4-cyclodiphosphate synthase [Candidatus Kapabacteria bacterium]
MVGFGYDVHRLESGQSLILGGVLISDSFGTIAHSDGDALSHSLIDALLGAAGLGDIGEHFPDTDDKYKNADSMKLLKITVDLLRLHRFRIINLDILIQLEYPKLKIYKPMIKKNVAEVCMIEQERVNIKAGTNEKMGFVGRSEGIAVYSVCLIEKFSE